MFCRLTKRMEGRTEKDPNGTIRCYGYRSVEGPNFCGQSSTSNNPSTLDREELTQHAPDEINQNVSGNSKISSFERRCLYNNITARKNTSIRKHVIKARSGIVGKINRVKSITHEPLAVSFQPDEVVRRELTWSESEATIPILRHTSPVFISGIARSKIDKAGMVQNISTSSGVTHCAPNRLTKTSRPMKQSEMQNPKCDWARGAPSELEYAIPEQPQLPTFQIPDIIVTSPDGILVTQDHESGFASKTRRDIFVKKDTSGNEKILYFSDENYRTLASPAHFVPRDWQKVAVPEISSTCVVPSKHLRQALKKCELLKGEVSEVSAAVICTTMGTSDTADPATVAAVGANFLSKLQVGWYRRSPRNTAVPSR